MPLLPTRDHKKRAQDSASPEAPLPRRPPAPADDLFETLADLADAVQPGDFGRRRGSAVAELDRLEDLRIGPEFEQLAERLLQVLEADDVDAAAALQVGRQLAQSELAGPQLHLDARARRLEAARPLLPERGEIEALGPLEAVLANAHRDEPRHAVDTHPGRAMRDEVPGA